MPIIIFFLEEALIYYNDFQNKKQEEEKKQLMYYLFKANSKMIMDLKDTLKYDQLCIVRNEEDTKYKYMVIRGQIKHILNTLRIQQIEDDNVILQINVSSGINLWNKCKENIDIKHEKIYRNKITKQIVSENDLSEDDTYTMSLTQNFNIYNITEEEFIKKVYQINQSKFNN